MSLTQWWKVAAVLLIAGATASGVEWLGGGTQAPSGADARPAQAGAAYIPEIWGATGEDRIRVRE